MSRVHNALRRSDSPNPDDPQKPQETEEAAIEESPPVEAAAAGVELSDLPDVPAEVPTVEEPAHVRSSRVAQALKKAGQITEPVAPALPEMATAPPLREQAIPSPVNHVPSPVANTPLVAPAPVREEAVYEKPFEPAAEIPLTPSDGASAPASAPERKYTHFPGLFGRIEQIPFNPSHDGSLLDPTRPAEGPIEEFRGLRTRLNHLQGLQKLHTVIVTSPSPAEGKSFTAANLAIAQSQLDQNPTLLVDFDFRRPSLHNLFQIERTPGMTEYLQGKVNLEDVIRRVGDSELYVIPAGEAVINPLELLNLPEVKRLLEYLSGMFKWVIADTPPLLFAADANLLSTMSDGTLLVVRIGSTTIDSVTRAIQSLCQNNILGIVVNGAHRGELYSKFTYYHSYYYSKSE